MRTIYTAWATGLVLLLALCTALPARADWEPYLSDTFDSTETSFPTGTFDEAHYSVDNQGRYIIDGMDSGVDSLSAINDTNSFYRVSADCQIISSTAGELAFCGLLFHYGKRPGDAAPSYYVFYAYGDGFYGVKRILGGGKSDVLIPLAATDLLTKGQPNTLAVEAHGNKFDLYINGQPVNSFTDVKIDGGGYGFYISKHSIGAFDNFTVEVEPAPQHPATGYAPGGGRTEGDGVKPLVIPRNPNRPLYPWEVGYDKDPKKKKRRIEAERQGDMVQEEPVKLKAKPTKKPSNAKPKTNGKPIPHAAPPSIKRSGDDSMQRDTTSRRGDNYIPEGGNGSADEDSARAPSIREQYGESHGKKPAKKTGSKPTQSAPVSKPASEPAPESEPAPATPEPEATVSESDAELAEPAPAPAPADGTTPEAPSDAPAADLALTPADELTPDNTTANQLPADAGLPLPSESTAEEPVQLNDQQVTDTGKVLPEKSADDSESLLYRREGKSAPHSDMPDGPPQSGSQDKKAVSKKPVAASKPTKAEKLATADKTTKADKPGATDADKAKVKADKLKAIADAKPVKHHGVDITGDDWDTPRKQFEPKANAGDKSKKSSDAADSKESSISDNKPATKVIASSGENVNVDSVPLNGQPLSDSDLGAKTEPGAEPEPQPEEVGVPSNDQAESTASAEQPLPAPAAEIGLPAPSEPKSDLDLPNLPSEFEQPGGGASGAPEVPSAVSGAWPGAETVSDDFTSQQLWHTQDLPTSSYKYANGGYAIDNTKAQTMAISFQQDLFANIDIAVEAQNTGGADYVGYGVAARFAVGQGAGGKPVISYYGLFISKGGEFMLLKVVNGQETVLQDWQTSPQINLGAMNTVELRLDGSQITALINGKQAAMVTDGDLKSGGYALLAGPGVAALFDNLNLSGVRP